VNASFRVSAGALSAAGCLLLAGCAAQPAAPKADKTEANTGLNALASDAAPARGGVTGDTDSGELAAGANYKPGTKLSEAELKKLADESAVDLEKLLAERNKRQQGAGKPIDTTAATDPKASSDAAASSEPVVQAAPVEPPKVEEKPVVDEDPHARVERLASELSGLIQKRLVTAADPVPDVLALAAIEALKPGGSAALPDGVDKSLSPPELKAVNAVRDLIRGLVGDPATARDPAKAADRVMEVLKQLSQTKPLTIARAALCSKVTGFGQYTAFGGNAFLAGSGQKAIIYTEVDGFAHREEVASGETMYGVELSQEAALFYAPDNTLQWRWPEQQVREVSRNKRRDFYVIRQIDLPRNLTVGQYVLKVTIRDKAEGKAVAQTSIPVTVVADPALVTAK